MQFNRPDLEKPVHGSIDYSELRALALDPKKVIDFSANINPLGISPRVKRAIANIDVERYPDPNCCELRQALSQSLNVARESIIIGNGSTDLIHLLARACLIKGSRAMILAPTFGEYKTACHLAGVQPDFIWASEDEGFQWDIDDTCRWLKEIKPQLVYLCNPNNPTGLYLDEMTVKRLAISTSPGILVIDEAYLPFVEKPWNSEPLMETGNVVLLRSMTKDHALAGLRLGYALAPSKLVEAMRLYQPFWSVNTAAQVAGLAALNDQEHVIEAKKTIIKGKAYIYAAMNELGIGTLPSSANFLLAKVSNARSVRQQLLKQNLCVRDCSSFGLPRYIRIAVQKLPECQKLVEGLKGVFSG